MDRRLKGLQLALPNSKIVQVGSQNVAEGPENTHTFLEWYIKERIGLVFVREAWIGKDDKGTQTHPSYILISIAKQRRRMMAYMKKGMEDEVKVVAEEDNHIII